MPVPFSSERAASFCQEVRRELPEFSEPDATLRLPYNTLIHVQLNVHPFFAIWSTTLKLLEHHPFRLGPTEIFATIVQLRDIQRCWQYRIPSWFLRRGSQRIHRSAMKAVCHLRVALSYKTESDINPLEALLLGEVDSLSESGRLPVLADGNAETTIGNDEAYIAYLEQIIPVWACTVAEAGPELPEEEQEIVDDGEVPVPVRLFGWHQWKECFDYRRPYPTLQERSRFSSNDWAFRQRRTYLTVLS